MTVTSEKLTTSDQSPSPARRCLGVPISLEDCLAAYQQTAAQFGFAPICRPGRWKVLGWDLEYVCAPTIVSFIDQLLVRRLNDFLPDNDQPLILDCGANIGFSVLNFKRQFPHARIIAFEPDPQFAPVLHRNMARNGAADVEVIEAAVWVKHGEVRWLCEGIDGSKILTQDHDAPGTVTVRTVDLADYLSSEIEL